MIDWPLALATASQAIKLVGDLRSVDREINESELKLKIADLTSTLADLKMTLTEARGDAAERDATIGRLEALHRRLSDETVEAYGYRYRKRLDGRGPAGNPFCDVCFQKEGFLIETTHLRVAGRPLQCPNCKAMYGDLHTYVD